MSLRALRSPGEGGGDGGEGADKGKAQPAEKIRDMTPEEFLAKHPEFKTRLDTGDAAVQERENAKKTKLEADGKLDELLKTEQDEHVKTKTESQKLKEENRALKRTTDIRDHLDTVEKPEYPAAAIKRIALTIDDGKMSVEELVKKAVAELKAMGLAPAVQKTDDLGGGGSGSGGGSGQGADADNKIAQLIALGAQALKTQKDADKRAYSIFKEQLRTDKVELPKDLATRIEAARSKAA